jgi:hypothetical protein
VLGKQWGGHEQRQLGGGVDCPELGKFPLAVCSPAITDALQCGGPPVANALYNGTLADGVCSCCGNNMSDLVGQLLHSGMRHMVVGARWWGCSTSVRAMASQ